MGYDVSLPTMISVEGKEVIAYMEKSWKELMTRYDLEELVRQFVMDYVFEYLGDAKHPFFFQGQWMSCDNTCSHIPHVLRTYETPYGTLCEFCLGKTGDNIGEPVIFLEECDFNDGPYPDSVKGHWYVLKEEKD